MEKMFVTIYPRESRKHLPKDILLEANMKIGAAFTESGEIATGLTLDQKKKWLPVLVEVSADDPTFFAKVKAFYAPLTIKVPIAGVKLNIALDKNGDPVNVLDYIKYRFALVSPKVSEKEELHPDSDFYIENPQEKRKERKSKLDLKKAANKEFLKATANPQKIEMLVVNLGLWKADLDSDDFEMVLDEYIESNPQRFLEVAKDPNLEIKCFINKCVSAEVLRKVGTSIINGDMTIGNSDDDAVAYLNDKANSEVLATLKARLQEFEKTL